MDLAARDRKVIWHPFTPQKYMADPIPVVKGDGVYIFDEGGNKYIDAISSWWVNLHGHCHPHIVRKIGEQAATIEHVIFAGFTHRPAIELAERLLALLPGNMSRIFYSDDGSTSTEVAIKMALQYWWNKATHTGATRTKILAFENSYHGDTFGAMSASDRNVFTAAFRDKLFDVVFMRPPTEPGFQWPTGVAPEDVACFIYEPLVQGAGGMRMCHSDGLNNLLAFCKAHDIICIADEVMTGFGRTGKLFASQHCVQQPDIICLSKGLTGGTMALGVTACHQKIYEAFVSDDALKTFFHGHSFTANPIACAAALASLDLLLEPECLERMAQIESAHAHFLHELQQLDKKGKTKNHRQLGTIVAFELSTGRDEYLNTSGSAVADNAMRRGVYIRPLGNTIYVMPPYCINASELQQVYRVIEEAILPG